MNLRQHKLAWRWTDSRYAVLPEHVLNRLLPVNEAEAQLLHQHAMAHLGKDALSPEFTSVSVGTVRFSSEEGARWLTQQNPLSDTDVVLSWDSTTAIKMSWKLFVEYWQEFCYPVSDDLVVLPALENWVLLYHHEEEFHFGRRTGDPTY